MVEEVKSPERVGGGGGGSYREIVLWLGLVWGDDCSFAIWYLGQQSEWPNPKSETNHSNTGPIFWFLQSVFLNKYTNTCPKFRFHQSPTTIFINLLTSPSSSSHCCHRPSNPSPKSVDHRWEKFFMSFIFTFSFTDEHDEHQVFLVFVCIRKIGLKPNDSRETNKIIPCHLPVYKATILVSPLQPTIHQQTILIFSIPVTMAIINL